MHFWFCFYVIRSGICFYHQFQSSDYLPKCCILEKEVRSHRTPNGWFVLMFYVSFSLWFLLLFYYFYSNMQNDWMNIVIDRKALELAAQSCPWIKWLSEAKGFHWGLVIFGCFPVPSLCLMSAGCCAHHHILSGFAASCKVTKCIPLHLFFFITFLFCHNCCSTMFGIFVKWLF